MNGKITPQIKCFMAALILSGVGISAITSPAYSQSSRADSDFDTDDFRGAIDGDEDDFGYEDIQENPEDAYEPVELSGRTRGVSSSPEGRVTSNVGDDDEDGDDDQNIRSNVAVEPLQTGTESNFEEDPFGPTGFRVGSFNANASLEQAIGYSSNLRGTVDGSAGAFSQTDVSTSMTSDWSRHEWRSSFTGSYRKPFDSDEIDRPNGYVDTALRLDLVDGYTLTTTGYYNFTTQSFTSDTLAPGAVDTPSIQSWGGNVELQRADRKLQLTLRGSVDRTIYGEADLGGGATLNQGDRNNNIYQLTARVGYETSPAITPFVEGSVGWRVYDIELDRNGNRRDSEIFDLRGGVELDISEKLLGEISVGYTSEAFEDPLLASLEGITVEAELEWSPERDTIVRFIAGTELNGSITANESGSLIYVARAELERQINSRLALNGFVDYEINDNDEQDTTIGVGVGLEYWLNRYMALTADAEYESFSSNVAGDAFDETSARVGILLQR